MKLCQSCGMPMEHARYGTMKDGSLSEDYCEYCLKDGVFTADCTMAEMIDFCAPIWAKEDPGMSEEQAKAIMNEMFLTLKRWQTTDK